MSVCWQLRGVIASNTYAGNHVPVIAAGGNDLTNDQLQRIPLRTTLVNPHQKSARIKNEIVYRHRTGCNAKIANVEIYTKIADRL